MPLFRDHPVRSTAAAAIGLVVAYATSNYLSSPHAMQLTQTTVALLALAGLILLVTIHHRRDGNIMTQTQEEMVLIASFALFWMATMLAWRALSQRTGAATKVESGLSSSTQAMRGRETVRRVHGGTYCEKDDLYCIIEEYYF